MTETIQHTIFAILRSALGIEKLSGPVELRTGQWKSLLEVSLQQNVAALVYDELQSAGCNMPDSIKKRWLSYSEFSARRFDAQLLALVRLSALLESQGIRMMVLKGMGLALTYPKPQLRECGDIDIFCYDDYDKVNEFVIGSGLDPNARETEEKHFGLEINGIEVENHRKFCTENNRANNYMGKVLMDMAPIETLEDSRLPGIHFPSAQMGALHLIAHTLMHLWWSGITLRHLCDVTMYLRTYRNTVDMEGLLAILKEAGVEKSAAALLNLCNNCLHLGADLNGWQQYGEKAEKAILRSIFHPFRNSCSTSDPLRKFYLKIQMYRFRESLYRLVYGEKYPEKFLETFVCLRKSKPLQ